MTHPATHPGSPSKRAGTGREGAAAAALAVSPPAESRVVPEGGSFEGRLVFRGSAAIEGHLRGSVRGTGTLRIGPRARLEAAVEVDELLVEGRLEGDVVARRRVELTATADVEGEIRAPRVRLADGCRFRGRCRTGRAAEALDVSSR